MLEKAAVRLNLASPDHIVDGQKRSGTLAPDRGAAESECMNVDEILRVEVLREAIRRKKK